MISNCPDRTPTLQERAPWVLEDLAAATRSPARLGVLHELDVAYIEKPPGHRPVTGFTPAATLPAHPTALGRALLAFSPPGVVEMTILRGLRPYTAHTITSPDRFRRALATTRLTRVAVTRFELEAGSCGVAMPVFGPAGDVLAAIELTVRDLRPTLQPLLVALTIAARSLSRELAGTAPTDTGRTDTHARPVTGRRGQLTVVGWRESSGSTRTGRELPVPAEGQRQRTTGKSSRPARRMRPRPQRRRAASPSSAPPTRHPSSRPSADAQDL